MDKHNITKPSTHCFVCKQPIKHTIITYNRKVNLPVCEKCAGTQEEKLAETEALDSLADDFVCGCI